MRRNYAHCVLCVLIPFFLIAFSSCGHDVIKDGHVAETQGVEVCFYAGGAQTRTEIGDNGLSAFWTADDQLAVWACTSSGTYVLSNQIFNSYGLDGYHGYFTSSLSSEMPNWRYNYYSCYPVPESVSGSSAIFRLPSLQDGKVTSGADIMIATPVTHGPLETVPEVEDHGGLSLKMNRMMHQFRFQIPSTDTYLQGASITKIKLAFPVEVVGKVSLDYTDPSKPAALSEGSKDVTLDLSEPLTVQKQNYACVAFVPTKFTSGQSLGIKAYTTDKIVYMDPVNLRAKDCLAGHSTPVMLIIKSVSDYPYQLKFTVAANNLGEEVNAIRFEAPEGCRWSDSDSNVYTYRPGYKISAGEEIVFRFEDEEQYRQFSNSRISVTYDSDNALTYQNVILGDLTSVDKANVSLTVPYLFYEDFSGIPSFSDGHDNPSVGMSSDTYKGITELSSFTSELAGWYGTRIGGDGGKSIRICCRYEHVLLAGAYYKGRVYTPFLSNIKDGKDVRISVSFRYGSNRSERDPLLGSRPDKSPVLYFGVNTEAQVSNPDRNEGDLIDQVTGLVGGSGYASNAVTSLSPIVIKGETLPKTGGSYTDFAGTRSVEIDNVDNGMRLSWVLSTDNTASNTNANYWLYIDDIKVSISK